MKDEKGRPMTYWGGNPEGESPSVDCVVLLPCPFCGPTESQNTFHHPQVVSKPEPVAMSDSKIELYYVMCPTCESRGPLHGNAEAAKAAWSYRPRPKCIHDLVKEYSENTTADF